MNPDDQYRSYLLWKLQEKLEAVLKTTQTTELHNFQSHASVSENLEKMIRKEIDTINAELDTLQSKGIEKRVLTGKELEDVFKDVKLDTENGRYFRIEYITHATELAILVSTEEFQELWIPRSMSEVRGNLLFIRNWLIREKDIKGGEEIHLKDFEKINPIERTPFKPPSYSQEQQFDIPAFCPACMESPCMCSDPY